MNVGNTGYITSCINAKGYIYHKAEKYYGKAYQVFINIYGAYSIAKDVFYLPQPIHDISKTIGYIGVVDIAFAGPRLVTNITDLIACKSFHATIGAILEFVNVLSLATEMLDACKDFGYITQSAYSWTSHINYAFLPSQCIMLGQSLKHALDVVTIRQNISLGYVNEHAEDIQQTLSLSKKCRLKERSSYLLVSHKPTESQAFLALLRGRINVHCTLAVIDVVSTVAASILAAVSLIAPTTRLIVALYTATCVASIAYSILQALLVRRTLEVVEVKGTAHDAIDRSSLLNKAV